MAKRMNEDQQYMWRAVVTHTWQNGGTFTEYCGPFRAKNHATNSANLAVKNRYSRTNSAKTVTIQRSRLVWEDVETKEVT